MKKLILISFFFCFSKIEAATKKTTAKTEKKATTKTDQEIENEIWKSVDADKELSLSIDKLRKTPNTSSKKKDEYKNLEKAVNSKIPPILNENDIKKNSDRSKKIQSDIDDQLHKKVYGESFKNISERSLKRTESLGKAAVPVVAQAALFHKVGSSLSKKDKKKEEAKKKEKEGKNKTESSLEKDKEAEENLKKTQSQAEEKQSTTQAQENEEHQKAQVKADETSEKDAIEEKNGKETKKSKEEEEVESGEKKEGKEGLFEEIGEGVEEAAEVAVV